MKKSVFLFVVFLVFLTGATYYYVVHIKGTKPSQKPTIEILKNSELETTANKKNPAKTDSCEHLQINTTDSVHISKIFTDRGITIYYDINSSGDILTAQDSESLKLIADSLAKAKSGANIIVHTDNAGTPKAQFEFGKLQADKIKELFLASGVASKNLRASSMGPTQPDGDNTTAAGRALNRRIVIVFND